MSARFQVDFEPAGRRIAVDAGSNLLAAAQQAGVDLVAACGGMGICGTCLVRLVKGTLSAPTSSEVEQLSAARLADGYRLACQALPQSDVRIEIPPESVAGTQKMQVEGEERPVTLDPAVRLVNGKVEPPGADDLRSDWSRVRQALERAGAGEVHARLEVLQSIPARLRMDKWSVHLAIGADGGLRAALPPGAPLLGLAVDLGSTKLAVYLADLASGATLGRTGVMNPQIPYGEDVVSRIAYANQGEENRRLLQTRVVEVLNQTAAELCQAAGAQAGQIVDAVVVGNTAMHHLFCGLEVRQLGMAPYVPVVSEALDLPASGLGLDFAPGAEVHLPPNIAGYVGGDHTAALLTTLAYPPGRTLVLVDIGTNTEISLVHAGRIWTCSTASGPAFEGAHIHDGMRAAPGAVDRVHIREGGVQVGTIGGAPAVGICGTGILSAVSEMLRAGVVDGRGSIRRDAAGVRLAEGKPEFVLVPAEAGGHGRDVVVTRRDVHEILLAKGAIRTGIEVLLAGAGIGAGEVDDWVIAGAFGTFLDVESALRVGMFPPAEAGRFHQVGNAAGVGARQMLLSRGLRARAARLAAEAQYVELTTHAGFMDIFVRAMGVGE